MFYSNSPLEQFNVLYYLLDLQLFPMTNVHIFMIYVFILFLFYLILTSSIRSFNFTETWGNLNTQIALLVKGSFGSQLGENNQVYIPLVFHSFLTISFFNLTGLIPYSMALTSQFPIVLALALMFFIGAQINGVLKYGIKFFRKFCPMGVPTWVLGFVTLVEFISYSFRVVSLAIRLIANITAGHILLKIISVFIWIFIYASSYAIQILWALPLLLLGALFFLEICISLLQAYVFVILSCIYIRDACEMDH